MRSHTLAALAALMALTLSLPANAEDAAQTALCEAAANGTPDAIAAAAGQGGNVNAICADWSVTPLEIAAQKGNEPNVVQLLNLGATADLTDPRQSTALSFSRSAAVTQILLAHGADVNRRDSDGSTALMALADFADQIPEQTAIDIAQQLLDKGADINATDNVSHATALINAVNTKYPRFVELLIAHGADLNIRNSAGNTALDVVLNAIEMVPRVGEDPAPYLPIKDILIAHGGVQ